MKTILVVDDNPQVRTSLCTLLQRQYPETRIMSVPNGQQALFAALAERPGVIVLDGEMPIMNGYEAAHRLRQMPRTSSISLVAYTGEQEANAIVSGLRRLCDACLSKGASDSQIMTTMGPLHDRLSER